ncbi:MAG: hypothetical protein WC966_00635 [Bradymonadales bacterium]
MKKPLLILLCALIMGLSSCAVDKFYDSVSTEVNFEIPQTIEAEKSIKTHRRFLFDRDLSKLSLKAHNAWLSLDRLKHGAQNVDISLVKSLEVYIINTQNQSRVLFLQLPAERIKGNEAEFKVILDDVLQDYIWNQRVEIETVATLKPYEAFRYRQENCVDEELGCSVSLSISLWFEIEN